MYPDCVAVSTQKTLGQSTTLSHYLIGSPTPKVQIVHCARDCKPEASSSTAATIIRPHSSRGRGEDCLFGGVPRKIMLIGPAIGALIMIAGT